MRSGGMENLSQAPHVIRGARTGLKLGMGDLEDLLFDAESTRRAIEDLQQVELDALIVLQVTFTDATMTTELASAIDAPLIFWAFPEARTGGRLRLNALCGINLAAHALRRRGQDLSYVYLRVDDRLAPRELARLLGGGANVDTAARIVPSAEELSTSALRAAERVEEMVALWMASSMAARSQPASRNMA